MPRATNDIQNTRRVELKSCEGGFVELRRMTYGQWLKRQEIAMTMKMTGAAPGEQNPQNMAVDVGIQGQAVAHFEFAACIQAHNLEDDSGNPLDFKQAWAVEVLDPRVGQEIGDEIDRMNQMEPALGN